jgi:hypothetical protein
MNPPRIAFVPIDTYFLLQGITLPLLSMLITDNGVNLL